MPFTSQFEPKPLPLRAVLRTPPELAPEDSLGRYLLTLRQMGIAELPIVQNGKFCGVVSQSAAFSALQAEVGPERDALLQQSLAHFLTPPLAVAKPDMTVAEVGTLCSEYRMPQVFVVDDEGYCLGMVLVSDLLLPTLPRTKPGPIGGMATPFGVYLTDGSRQGGVGNLALVASGAFMGILFAVATLTLDGVVKFGLKNKWLPTALFADPLPGTTAPLAYTLTSGLLTVFAFFVFMLLMRATRLAGYHAAEHQTVHALERNEPLVPNVVARMPRPHPRCGTNLMAAGFLFFGIESFCSAIPQLADLGFIFAFMITLTTWRQLGTFLQAHFTTRPASEHQLRSGIAAAEELLEKYYNSPPGRPKTFQRLWCMGMLQVLIGMTLTTVSIAWVWDRLVAHWFG